MESPLETLRLILLCFVFFISASIFVDSQSQDSSITPPPPPPPPPPSYLLSPPPPQLPPPPVRVVESNKAIHDRRKNWRQRRKSRNQNHHQPHRKQHKVNTGKTVGLFFVGVAAALQVVVAVFLLFKRRQLLHKINDRH